ncbi:MAG: ATP-binding protein [Tannerellaceae bacterium]|nr:ATP-binding protein [Tannerellaceae bacterium]
MHEGDSVTYGVVEEINHITDAPSHFTSYISSDFGDVEDSIGNMNRLGMNYVKARVICNTKNIYTPVLDSKQVSLCNEDDIRTALGLDDVKNPLVCGYLQMYQGKDMKKIKVELNSHFLMGPEGAHMNISGISGLGAKTSYAMFLLNAIQHKFISEDGTSVAFVFFNVKGRDLMAIDEPNKDLRKADKEIYEKDLKLSTEPFKNVRYYYPYGKEEIAGKVQSYALPEDIAKQKKENKAFAYKFTFDKSQDKLDLLLANDEDNSGTLESCINYIINREGNFDNINKWTTFNEEVDKCTKTGTSGGTRNEIQVASWRKFKRCIGKAIRNDVFAKVMNNGEVDITDEIANNLRANQVMVIDIARLDENTQSFVFGSVARAIYDMKLGADRTDIPDKVILFVDELNKYASTDIPKSSPILHQLMDIAERGRSLGIILFSAEQFRSAIYDRVKGNCATQAYGRTNAIEVSKPDYKYIPKVYQNMMTRLTPGEYIISNPALRSIVNIKFPKPLYKQFPNG